MIDLDQLLHTIDTLSPEEFERVYRHVVKRRQTRVWLVPGENLQELKEILRPVHQDGALMTDEEINNLIDEELRKVRSERNTSHRRRD